MAGLGAHLSSCPDLSRSRHDKILFEMQHDGGVAHCVSEFERVEHGLTASQASIKGPLPGDDHINADIAGRSDDIGEARDLARGVERVASGQHNKNGLTQLHKLCKSIGWQYVLLRIR